jgi:dipeptidyl aminopeptidase/acylaminoacyl peptidase
MTRALLLLLSASVLAAQTPSPAARKPFDVHALQQVARISDPQLSPDGLTVAFVVQRVFLSENRTENHIFVVPTDGTQPSRQITFDGKSNTRPRWSPDSQRMAYVSDRSGSSQVWLMAADGSGSHQVTRLSTEADGVLYAPAGDRLIFTSRVYPECEARDECNARRLEAAKADPVQARLIGGLLYRRWDRWRDGRVSHILSLDLSRPDAVPVDLTPGEADAPPFSLGGPDGYAISPDGMEVCFERKSGEDPARDTNSDLWIVPVAGGQAQLITRNPAADGGPSYAPDGAYIAYRAQERPGYESDRFRLMLHERRSGRQATLTGALDRWVTGYAWSKDSSRLFFTAEDRGRSPIYTVRATGGAAQIAVYGNASHSDVQLLPDGASMIYAASSASHPAEIYRAFSAGGEPRRLTRLNDDLLAQYELNTLEEVNYAGADGRQISGFLLRPPNFSMANRYPLLTLIHGGPQGAWGEAWSYRWNPQVFAAAGFVVFLPNPRGSTGYGQAFTDEIRGDWGGKPFDDIIAGIDHVIARPYVDATRLAAAGASYGGYMVNWMLGQTNRFRALVSHGGVYDLPSFFGATEELWFPLWDFQGAPWDNPYAYERWSPSRNAARFRTPTLVIHGEKDYRVPSTQGMQLFTALQARGVPSQFLSFPDEGHWVLKPANSVYWHRTVINWLTEWINRPLPADDDAVTQP